VQVNIAIMRASLQLRPLVSGEPWGIFLAEFADTQACRTALRQVLRGLVPNRRWDEQWKVSNRWLAGPVAYAQEFVEAFRWWLAEKAEWHLEHIVNAETIRLRKEIGVVIAQHGGWPLK